MKVLIVEDEPNILNGLRKLVKKFEPLANITTCDNGLDGLKKCKSEEFDLIFTDIKMPGMDGLEMIENIDHKIENLVIVSGYRDFDYAHRAISKGVLDYILKPINPIKIKEILEKVKSKIEHNRGKALKDYLINFDNMEDKDSALKHIGINKYYTIYQIDTEIYDEKNIYIKEDLEYIHIKIKNHTIVIATAHNKSILEDYKNKLISNIGSERILISDIDTNQENIITYYKNFKLHLNNENNLVKVIKEYIHNNYSKNITLNELANIAYVHPTYISKIFKKETGKNLTDYILEYRIKKSKQLLKDNQYKIYEVAQLSGFKDSKYFGNVFKSATGVTPSEYRNTH